MFKKLVNMRNKHRSLINKSVSLSPMPQDTSTQVYIPKDVYSQKDPDLNERKVPLDAFRAEPLLFLATRNSKDYLSRGESCGKGRKLNTSNSTIIFTF